MLAQALCTADLVEKKDAEEVLEKYTEVCVGERREGTEGREEMEGWEGR